MPIKHTCMFYSHEGMRVGKADFREFHKIRLSHQFRIFIHILLLIAINSKSDSSSHCLLGANSIPRKACLSSLTDLSISFFLFGAISPLFSSSILGTYRPGEFIFQCHMFLPFHTVHGVLKVRILKWFAIPFSSGPHFVRSLYHDRSALDGPTWHGS